MTCGACGHRIHDHIDRAFGGWFCAPAAGTGGFVTKRCECPGWRMETEVEVMRRSGDVAAYVRAAMVAAFPWLRLPKEAA